MNDECSAASPGNGGNKPLKLLVTVLVIDADTAFHGDRYIHFRCHRRHAFGHQLRLRHQAGAELSGQYAIAGAAHIDVDFVIAMIHANARALSHGCRIAAAQLQSHWALTFIHAQQAFTIAVNHRSGGEHFRIQPGMPADQAQKVSFMPISPVQHGRDTKPPTVLCHETGIGTRPKAKSDRVRGT